MQKCVQQVYEFNEISGNFEVITKKKLLQQVVLMKEEVDELYNAINNNEGNEQTGKETCDVLVTTCGLVGMLEKVGFNIKGLWTEVNENNLTKFPTNEIQVAYSVSAYKNSGVNIDVSVYNDKCFVLKDENGKIRKPINYKPMENIHKFVPETIIK